MTYFKEKIFYISEGPLFKFVSKLVLEIFSQTKTTRGFVNFKSQYALI